MNLTQIQEDVKNTLSENRYYHSKCVMDMCEELAIIYNIDIEIAKKVGIAHDIAKEMSADEKLRYAFENGIEVDDVEKVKTGLLHAKIGADIAIKKYGFTPEMGQAICDHTTGNRNMSILSKILYIADWTGEDRKLPEAKQIKKLAKTNIDEAMIYALEIVFKQHISERRTNSYKQYFSKKLFDK